MNTNNKKNKEFIYSLISSINELQTKGQKVVMKNKLEFELTLAETKGILVNNLEYLSNFSISETNEKDPYNNSYNEIIKKLNIKLNDLEDKLQNLALISFCRSKAEKYLDSSRKDLSYINMVLISIINKNATLHQIDNSNKISKNLITNDAKNYDNDIQDINKEIIMLKSELKEKQKPLILQKQNTTSFKVNNQISNKESKNYISDMEIDYNEGIKYYYGVDTCVNYSSAYILFSQAILKYDNMYSIKTKKILKSNNKINDKYVMKVYASTKYMIGKMYQNGYFVDKNLKTAVGIFKDSSDLGHSNSSIELAYLSEQGIICETDKVLFNDNEINYFDLYKSKYYEVAFKYYSLAALEQNSSQGYYLLGCIYENKTHNVNLKNEPKNFNLKKAFEYYKKSIEIDNNPNAVNAIGNMLYKGTSILQVKEDLNLSENSCNISNNKLSENCLLKRKAFEKFKYASNCGNLDALNSLGVCYELGQGVEMNKSKAYQLYDKASKDNHPIALANKAIYLINNNKDNNRKIYKEAFKLLNMSIYLHPKNNKNAYYYLGYMHQNGYNGIKFISDQNYNINKTNLDYHFFKDEFNAYRMYKKAMKRGHINSTTKVGLALYNGISNVLEKDEDQAYKLFKFASEKGDEEASNYLGLLFEYGSKIISKDIDKSIYYYNQSMTKGDPNATYNLATLNYKISKNNCNNQYDSYEDTEKENLESYKNLLKLSTTKGNEFSSKLQESTINENTNLLLSISKRLDKKLFSIYNNV